MDRKKETLPLIHTTVLYRHVSAAGPAGHLFLVLVVCRNYDKKSDFAGPPSRPLSHLIFSWLDGNVRYREWNENGLQSHYLRIQHLYDRLWKWHNLPPLLVKETEMEIRITRWWRTNSKLPCCHFTAQASPWLRFLCSTSTSAGCSLQKHLWWHTLSTAATW